MKHLARELESMWALEEIKARQHSRDRIILEGDRNTTYFHAIANQRMRKKRIECLKGPNGLVYDTQEILAVVADFYKGMFKWESRGSMSLGANFWSIGDSISDEENVELVAPFTE
jgi:hypothetical protein